ncbi:putative dynein heavy chain [Trypanosoma theileri]|uniref:Putative dynein heavy chain n=1 Tax=Trypanosoma theileri TaxID=67003 RepID=A0A1X0NY64_9TRYP|nr:putative dynein heavy chain [Trypanosoma theileri]ORC89612.1 putative dynein heavy chain [Trypanosoma theileri]
MVRSRSAEQTARVLLSNAVRYDTWESKALKENTVGSRLTLRLTWDELPLESPFMDVVALQMTLFDKNSSSFIGATYTVSRQTITEPIIFQTSVENVVLALELVAHDERSNAPVEGRRVLLWGYIPISNLASDCVLTLQSGSAQLLLLDPKSWPTNNKDAVQKLGYKCSVVEDVVLVQLMTRLVPPGIFVPQSFTESTPQASTSSFRCVVTNIQLNPTSEEAEWYNSSTEWRVAAVAHNGYQQLGQGAEVPLVFDYISSTSNSISDDRDTSSDSHHDYHIHHNEDEDNDSVKRSASSFTMSARGGNVRHRVLHSVMALTIDALPVHSATSLVLAIRRRRVGESQFEVLGFCVFPLCVMPVRDRDLRVENLPTLQGPFACRDPRLLMLEPSSPYGKLPMAVTLTVEYYDTEVPAGMETLSLGKEMGGYDDHQMMMMMMMKKSDDKTPMSDKLITEDTVTTQIPFTSVDPGMKNIGILSTEEHIPPKETGTTAIATSPQNIATLTTDAAKISSTTTVPVAPKIELSYPLDGMKGQTGKEDVSIDVFKMLCNVMEELRRLREMQEEIMRYGRPRGIPADRVTKTGKRLDDATEIDVVDLSPTPVSISWEVRCQIEENLQPILHPVRGTPLEVHVPASNDMTASLYGIRFEGLSTDTAIEVPVDVCFMFSFGPLPFQTIGPIHTSRIDKTSHVQTFKLYEGTQRGGMVWCEPIEAAEDPFLQKYKKNGDITLYIHVYDALTMFYIGSANVQLKHFRRPYNAESSRTAMDLPFYRDLSLTEKTVPAKVLPIMRNAGQLHVTLFCVGVGGGNLATVQVNRVIEPPKGSRVIVAKKLPHANIMEQLPDNISKGGEAKTLVSQEGNDRPSSNAIPLPIQAAGVTEKSQTSEGQGQGGEEQQQQQSRNNDINNKSGEKDDIHWRRAQYVKQLYGSRTSLSGVSSNNNTNNNRIQEADLEFRLRYLEKQRDEMKSRKIAETLMARLTVHHHLCVAAFRPEKTRTLFENPFNVAMRFCVEIDSAATGALEVLSSPSFLLGPRERTEVVLVIRLNTGGKRRGNNNNNNNNSNRDAVQLRARLYAESGRELVRVIDIHATVGPPFVDRRYEIYGVAGTRVSKKFFSRLFPAALFPITSDTIQLLNRMRAVCGHVGVASPAGTMAEVNAVLDPITQTYMVAWEEITMHVNIPAEGNQTERVEYMTLFADEAMSEVIETWELCVFACNAVTSRELLFGQTTTVALPSAGIEALYCSDPHVKVIQRESSYLLRMRPQEVGTQQLLLHTLTNQHLAKTLLTVPTVYPTPTYTQALELSLADMTAPVFRRLQFVHRGQVDEVFTVHHNYKYQLSITPKQFALAPGDSQFITLQIDMLTLPEGKTEGRWPMWIFINNGDDKTVESYLLQVVLRAHRIVHEVPP